MKPVEKVNGVALVVHGLNNRPTAMNAIRDSLTEDKMVVVCVILAGHNDESKEELRQVNRSLWLNNIMNGYLEAAAIANKLGVSLNLVAYSLGALVALDFLSGSSKFKFDKMILFAPALVPRFYVNAIRKFKNLPNHSIPSKAPIDYRAHSEIPISIYNALFDCIDHTHKQLNSRLNISTLFFIDPFDELISLKGTLKLLSKHQLSSWLPVEVSNSGSSLTMPFHHLIIDERAVGFEQWQIIKKHMTRFLQNPSFSLIPFNGSK